MLYCSVLLFFSFFSCTSAAVSNHPIHWGFQKNNNHQPPDAGKEWNELLNKYGAFYLGDPSKKEIYLTFDNGYENGYTSKILDVLKKHDVHATFFVTGHYLKTAPDLVKRMVKEGHIVGNHSWSHPDMTTISADKIKKELDAVSDKVKELTGQEGTVYVRPPRGIFSERTLALSEKYGYLNIFWSLAFVDWKVNEQKGWRYAYDNIINQIHPGAIILLHTVSKDNADALDEAIKTLKQQGYTFKSLDDLVMEKMFESPFLY
ncbi:delta-lactam-biosynthetic de-N-acetylase [Bacillaceae bacterium ZC4]|nr:delta-lactam-biosynthetic de-N-acetylase [Bacillaceae bacterium ZC4]